MNHHQHPDPLNQAREFWGTIALHRWGILLATVVLAALAIVVISLMPDSYVASTTVLFDPQKLPERYVAPTVTADPAQRLNTLTQEVLSAGRLQEISQQLHLSADPGKTSQQIVNQMRKDITVEMKPNSEREISAFVISYTGQAPQLVAAVANRLAQSFIDWDLANREQQAASTTEFMARQLQDAKLALDKEQAAMDEYKHKHSGQLPEQLSSNMQALSQFHVALQANGESLDRLEQERTMLTAVPESARPVAANPSERDRLEAERRTLQAELAQLRSQYTEQYPDVVTARDRLAALTKQLSRTEPGAPSIEVSSAAVRLQIIARETERLQEEKQRLVQRIDRYQAQVDATAVRGQEIEYLNRNYTSARDQYEGLLDKKLHAEMAMELERQQKAGRFTVDPAQVPERPIKPNRLLLLAMALPFCGLFPAGMAVAAAEVRGTVNSERTLRSLLPDAAHVVGHIPMIETPLRLRKRRRFAMLSILGSLTCCAAVAAFLLGGTAAHMRRNHQFGVPASSAKVFSR
jgi:polysaccharide chain length determinant protein (PEP-CTERM system associated)